MTIGSSAFPVIHIHGRPTSQALRAAVSSGHLRKTFFAWMCRSPSPMQSEKGRPRESKLGKSNFGNRNPINAHFEKIDRPLCSDCNSTVLSGPTVKGGVGDRFFLTRLLAGQVGWILDQLARRRSIHAIHDLLLYCQSCRSVLNDH